MGTTDVMSVDANGSTAVNQTNLGTALNQIPAGTLTTAEGDGLAYMREEEKPVGDVYLTLFATWNQPIFQNIAGSEATHTSAVKTLLNRYGLQDPAANQAEASLRDSRAAGNTEGIAWAIASIADNAFMYGDDAYGHALLDESLQLFAELKHTIGQGNAMCSSRAHR
jgi:hypothetical protein